MRAGERVKHLISLDGCNDMSHYKVMVDDNFHYGKRTNAGNTGSLRPPTKRSRPAARLSIDRYCMNTRRAA